jgi:hypothetical protein
VARSFTQPHRGPAPLDMLAPSEEVATDTDANAFAARFRL